ncbi:hypothetical protein YC2023_084905 [Brassica napus]
MVDLKAFKTIWKIKIYWVLGKIQVLIGICFSLRLLPNQRKAALTFTSGTSSYRNPEKKFKATQEVLSKLLNAEEYFGFRYALETLIIDLFDDVLPLDSSGHDLSKNLQN